MDSPTTELAPAAFNCTLSGCSGNRGLCNNINGICSCVRAYRVAEDCSLRLDQRYGLAFWIPMYCVAVLFSAVVLAVAFAVAQPRVRRNKLLLVSCSLVLIASLLRAVEAWINPSGVYYFSLGISPWAYVSGIPSTFYVIAFMIIVIIWIRILSLVLSRPLLGAKVWLGSLACVAALDEILLNPNGILSGVIRRTILVYPYNIVLVLSFLAAATTFYVMTRKLVTVAKAIPKTGPGAAKQLQRLFHFQSFAMRMIIIIVMIIAALIVSALLDYSGSAAVYIASNVIFRVLEACAMALHTWMILKRV